MLCDENIREKIKTKIAESQKSITYELVFSEDGQAIQREFFKGLELNNAITKTAMVITRINNDSSLTNAYVSLARLPDDISSAGRIILSWTKPFKDLRNG